MNNILKHIQNEIGAENCSQSCDPGHGCEVYLDGITLDRVIANADSRGLDRFFPRSRCDFILFLENPKGLSIVPLELKSGTLPSSEHIVEQLQAGANFAQKMLKKLEKRGIISQPYSLVCNPILLHGNDLKKVQLRNLNQKRAKIDFWGTKRTIQTARCGKPCNLADALSTERGQSQGGRQR